MLRLHLDKGYFYLILFILTVTLLHFFIQIFNDDVPQILKHIINPVENDVLDVMYSREDTTNTLPYVFRNLLLRYIIYPAVLITFLFDHYGYGKYLNFFTWKKLLLTLSGFGLFVTIISKPYFACITNAYFSVWRFSYLTLCQINFRNSTAGYYIYAIILYVTLIVFSFKTLNKKLEVHQSLWLTLLVFLSIEEVWEYAPFIVFFPSSLQIPLIQVFSLNLMRAIPSILLIYYGWRYGLGKSQRWFWISFMVSILVSILYIVFSEYIFVSLFLRVFWVTTYILFVYSLNIGEKH